MFDGPAPDSGRFEPGTGWWCLGQSVAFTCFRAQTACEQKLAEINQSDAAEGEVSLTDACMQVTEVYCRTAISIEDQAGTTACFRNRLTCEEDGKGLAGSGYYEDVSGCGAIQ